MTKKGHIPIRMCIGCRKRRRKEEMVRLIRSPDGTLFTRSTTHLNRRGYYVCLDRICLQLARKKNRWLESLGSMERLIEGCFNE